MSIMDKITHCFLIGGGLGPNIISKMIMEELALSCTNEKPKNMLDFNKQRQLAMCDIKYVILVMNAHPKICTTCNI